MPEARIRDEVGSDRFHGGLLYESSAQMHMGSFAAGLADAADRRGARIFENAAVTRLEPLGRRSGTRVRDDPGHRPGEAGAARHRRLRAAVPFGCFRRRIVPVGSFIIATEPLGESRARQHLPTRRNATTSLNIGHYFRISPDDRLIFGGRPASRRRARSRTRKSGAHPARRACWRRSRS